jgi:hypothetical protein
MLPMLVQEVAQDVAAVDAPVYSMTTLLIMGVLIIISIAGLWKTFAKAGEPGWAAIIPFYNLYVMTKIAGKPGWWVLLCLIPLVNFVIFIIISIGIAKNFGKGAGFGLGLFFLGPIFYGILGFGDAQYQPTA